MLIINKIPPEKQSTYKKYEENIEQNDASIKDKKVRINEINSQLERLNISENFKWGLLALIYFSIVGVLFPTTIMPVNQELHLKYKWLSIFFFISGIASIFIYIFYELNYINKKK